MIVSIPFNAIIAKIIIQRSNPLLEMKSDFPSADIVGHRTVFNIKGNRYRLIARVNYVSQKVFVLHILPHAEYDEEKWK